MEGELKNELRKEAERHEGPSRRSFLAGTGGAALAAAATGLFNGRALSDTHGAPAAEKAAGQPAAPVAASSPKPPASARKYPHLLSPIKIGNYVLKNRIIGTASSPHFLAGPESAPNEALISYYANKARDGASVVILSQPVDAIDPKNGLNASESWGQDHFPVWDLANSGCQNLFSQLTEAVHFYGSLCLWKPKIDSPEGYDASAGVSKLEHPYSTPHDNKEIPEEMLQKIIEDNVLKATLGKECGFDGIFLHCAYRAPLTARMMSPITNHRTDKYGGSLENRARFIIQLADAIKKKCGQDYFILASISGAEAPEGGYTVEDAAEFAKLFSGHIDLLDVKGDPVDPSHPSYFILERTPYLYMAEKMKKLGVTMPLISDGGFTNLDWAEEALAAGKTDFVGMSRAFITNPNLGSLIKEGRGDDVVPCLRCNWCHGGDPFKPYNSTCRVNPVWGLEHKIDKMISPPKGKKNVAVIGGGPAGMEAALIASRRGHAVTLYEKTGKLGGNFGKIENVSFKWTHKDFLDYMVRQIGKSGVKLRLNVEATPETIRREGYDAVVVAVGAEPIMPDIPGAGGKNVVLVPDIYGKENALARDVAIVGGKEIGVCAGMHLAEKGHNVVVLEDAETLAADANHVHFYSVFKSAWEKLPTFKPIVKARCTGITEDGVTYIDGDGKQQSVKAGTVVLAMGMKARMDLACRFKDTAEDFYMVGDCDRASDLERAMRTAFSTASSL